MNRTAGRSVVTVAGTLAVAFGLCAPACFDFGNYTLRGEANDVDAGADAPEPDGSSSCTPPVPGGACGTTPVCGCEEGQTCDVVGYDGVTACMQDKGLALGDVCAGLFEGCGWGLTCADGTCKRFCSSGRACGSESACYQVVYATDGGTALIPGMKVCTDQCDLMSQEGCGQGAGCYPYGQLGVQPGHSVCRLAGGSTQACQSNEDCMPGRGCGEDGQCRFWCRYGVPVDCTPPLKCATLKVGESTGFFYLGDQAYGLCLK